MNKHLKIIILLSIFACNSFYNVAYGQKEIGNKTAEVKATAIVTKDNKILIRWGVTTPTAWKYSNKYGYIIERKTIVKNNVIAPNPETKQLNEIPIKPKPMLEWKEFTERSNNAAIAAQALFGEQFDVSMNEGGNGILKIINQAQILEQRFTFAYYAADQDFEVANFSGLAFEDTTAKQGERYLYNIRVALPNSVKYKIKKGGVYLGLIDYKPLPKPQEFVGVFKDKTTILSWNYEILKRYYSNYVVEKSEDNGKSFNNVANTPVTNLASRAENTSNRMMYVDSLFQNNKQYQYRIRGISPFGLKGPYSKIIKGKGTDPLIHNPFITGLNFQDNGNVVLNWEFPSEAENTMKAFQLIRANKVKGEYTLVNPSISKRQRSINLTNVQAINYYKIVAIGNDGNKRVSFPKMVQPDDSTPPAIPLELTGSIDSLGVVQLKWKQNTEVDFLGYRVFKANLKDDEFTQITFEPIPNSTIIDTVNIKTLNKKIYYKIKSFDKRYNPSEFSQVLELKRPDIVPPTSPVFTSFKTKGTKVKLNWVTSTSNDAKATLLYRKEAKRGLSWELIKEFPLPINEYTDVSTVVGKTYMYTIITVDESGLESEPITPLKISISDTAPKTPITRFNGIVDREQKFIKLDWKYNENNVQEFILYKGEAEKSPTMYKVLTAKDNSFLDKNLLINTKYTYLLQAVFNSGAKSPIKKIQIIY